MDLKYHLPIRRNNYVGVIGAVLGGIIGTIANLIILYLTDIFFSLTFALIPLAMYYGYLFFRGRVFKKLPIVISVLSVVFAILLTLTYEYIVVINEYGSIPLGAFLKAMFGPEVLPYLLQDLITPLIFIALGIWISWRKINEQL
jgi:hypothetical protein